MQRFVNRDWDGHCLAKGMHACKVVCLQGLLNILYSVWDTLREDSDGLLKVPSLVRIQAKMHSWPDCFTYGCHTLDLLLDAASQTYFQLDTTKAIFPGLLCSHNCSARSKSADNGVDRHGCSRCSASWREYRTDATSLGFANRIEQRHFK